jgi:hypothetical protein
MGFLPNTILQLLTDESIQPFMGTYFTGSIIPYSEDSFAGQRLAAILQHGSVNFERVQDNFKIVSLSMTRYIRQNGFKGYNTPAIGQVSRNETCVRIRWAWLIFPAVCVILMIMFFTAMVIKTNVSQHGLRHDFKTSPLALMFHGLDPDLQYRLGAVVESNRVGDLTEDAKSLLVTLSPTEKGWRFVS